MNEFDSHFCQTQITCSLFNALTTGRLPLPRFIFMSPAVTRSPLAVATTCGSRIEPATNFCKTATSELYRLKNYLCFPID